ncbi:hypothetical protein SALBM311S_05967 [Streptomyces alboniger]
MLTLLGRVPKPNVLARPDQSPPRELIAAGRVAVSAYYTVRAVVERWVTENSGARQLFQLSSYGSCGAGTGLAAVTSRYGIGPWLTGSLTRRAV